MHFDWSEYDRVHASRANLLIHLIAVPLFIAAFVSLIKFLLQGDWLSAAFALGMALLAMALQGNGHKREAQSPRPFAGPGDFLRRWFTEQFVVFPVFFVSGRWGRQFRATRDLRES